MSMQYTIEIKDARKDRHQASNENFLQVEADIVQIDAEGNRTVVLTKRLGMPVASTPEEVQAECQKQLDTFISGEEQKVTQAAIDAEDDAVAATRDALVGKELAPSTDETVEPTAEL